MQWFDRSGDRTGIGSGIDLFTCPDLLLERMDPRTIDMAERSWKTDPVTGFKETHPDNEDLCWVQKGVWGKLGYEE